MFADCDFDLAVNNAVKSAFLNQGQICLCGSRIFVEKTIYADFLSALEKTKQLVVGDPKNKKSNLGSIVSEEHLNNIISKINQAKEDGGKVLTGGGKSF